MGNIKRKFDIVELEWMLGQTGAVSTTIKEDPKPKIRDVLFTKLAVENDNDDNNDW